MLTSTVPLVVRVVLDWSLIVTPSSVYDPPFSTVTTCKPLSVTSGAVVSTTFTVLVTTAVLPSASTTV